MQQGVGDHAFGGLDPAEHHDRRIRDGLRLGQRSGLRQQGGRLRRRDHFTQAGGELGERRCPGRTRVAGLGRRGFGLHRGHDSVVPGQDPAWIGRAKPERLRHDRDGQRPGHGPAQFGRTARLDGRHQAAGLGPGERGEPRVNLVAPEGAVERTPVARVLRAVQREHAGPDHLGRGETRVIDRERPRITQDLHGQVVPGDEPGAEDAGTQLTGAAARSRASAGCGSASRSASVTRAAGVFDAGTLEHDGPGPSGRAGQQEGECRGGEDRRDGQRATQPVRYHIILNLYSKNETVRASRGAARAR